MKQVFDLKILPDGSIVGIYQDGLAEALGAKTKDVQRASNVEWEEDTGAIPGWTVRSAHHRAKAVRWGPVVPCHVRDEFSHYRASMRVSTEGSIAVFSTRETALEAEQHFFWELIKNGPSDST
jgi:hypothetical protein